MPSEAIEIELHGFPKGGGMRFDVGDGRNISEGTLLWLQDGKTISNAELIAVKSVPFAGIASADKIAGDGQTSIGVFRKGIFDLQNADKTINAGQLVQISKQNLIAPVMEALALMSGASIGMALEDGAVNAKVRVLLG